MILAYMTCVVAGVIEREGKVLICQRRVDQPHPLKWEFPGGKMERGESPEAALARELREELGIESEAGTELARYQFCYPDKQAILLIFIEVSRWRGEIVNRIFKELVWEEPARLPDYDFLEGDGPFISLRWQKERYEPGSRT
jgi:8-oxo-dGTP diphosphatase